MDEQKRKDLRALYHAASVLVCYGEDELSAKVAEVARQMVIPQNSSIEWHGASEAQR